eukprot:scaffold17207_cov36-Tisochrysis_lutea.AAC.3
MDLEVCGHGRQSCERSGIEGAVEERRNGRVTKRSLGHGGPCALAAVDPAVDLYEHRATVDEHDF